MAKPLTEAGRREAIRDARGGYKCVFPYCTCFTMTGPNACRRDDPILNGYAGRSARAERQE